MISFLHGKVVDALPTQVTLDVNGVGYDVLIPLSSYDKLPPAGQDLKLLTHLAVREVFRDGRDRPHGRAARAGEAAVRGRGERVGKGGVVRADGDRAAAVLRVREAAEALGYALRGEAESRLPGPKGNREVFLWMGPAGSKSD